ncbi:hypothetical protein [Nocardia brevicatena]|uniref:hypothetical protein n=1 Tax=Nocardia brevicatena TaxID=37327 RepID=UPI0005954EBA|nr:hypothetical protein [Nocardia brevicatena]
MHTPIRVDVPEAPAALYSKHSGASGRAWIAALPRPAADFPGRWALRLDGPGRHGMASLMLPATRTTPPLRPPDRKPSAWTGNGRPAGRSAAC